MKVDVLEEARHGVDGRVRRLDVRYLADSRLEQPWPAVASVRRGVWVSSEDERPLEAAVAAKRS